MKSWRIVLRAVAIGLLAAAIVLVLLHYLPVQRPQPPEESVYSSPPPVSSAPIILPDNPIDFAALQTESPDTVAWIRIPGTVIDYAILRSGDDLKDDNYYLHHDTDRSYKYAGSIYMQRVNSPDFTDPNTILYGHNMKNGSMFAAIHKFKNKEFFDQHRTIYIYTPGHILTYQIYSVFVYDDRLIPAAFDFSDPVEYASYQSMTLQPESSVRQVREGVALSADDRLITLSTCTGRDGQRLLLHGVLLHDQPTK